MFTVLLTTVLNVPTINAPVLIAEARRVTTPIVRKIERRIAKPPAIQKVERKVVKPYKAKKVEVKTPNPNTYSRKSIRPMGGK